MHEVYAKGILSSGNGMNIYRGCTHGCIYCDSRSECYQMKHDFEDIEVKINAPQLLETVLRRKRKKCMIGTGAMSDPYNPVELETEIMRKCLKIIERYGFGVSILTKSDNILRDLDLLKAINRKSKCVVQMTLTTYSEELCRIVEPDTATTKRRFEVLEILRENRIPTIVWLTPILPYINDTEDNIRGILDYCIKAEVKGIVCFGMGLTLRSGNREYFYNKLDERFAGLKQRYIREYGLNYEVSSSNNDYLMKIIRNTCKTNNIMFGVKKIFGYLSEFPKDGEQLEMEFD